MPLQDHDKKHHPVVSLGEDQVMRQLETQFPDAVAAARKRIAGMPLRHGLIEQMPPEEFFTDESDEIAIVGETETSKTKE